MISRGHYIGAIVDEFATIAEKIAMRIRLHLFDLTQHAELIFKGFSTSALDGALST